MSLLFIQWCAFVMAPVGALMTAYELGKEFERSRERCRQRRAKIGFGDG